MTQRNWWIIGILLLSIAGGVWYWQQQTPPEEKTHKVKKTSPENKLNPCDKWIRSTTKSTIGVLVDTTYNDIPYMGRVHSQTHIERIALAATLFGIESVNIQTCRVLELGCGDGSNLLNMAINPPNATFVDIDGSSVHIERANNMAKYAKIANVEFHAWTSAIWMNHLGTLTTLFVMEYSLGCPRVCEHTFWRCQEELTKWYWIHFLQCLPAWKQHEMLRDMMRFHAFRMDTLKNKSHKLKLLIIVACARCNWECLWSFLQSQWVHLRINGRISVSRISRNIQSTLLVLRVHQASDSNHLQYLGDTDLSSMLNCWPTKPGIS